MCRGVSVKALGWKLNIVDNAAAADLWFSDGEKVGAVRSGSELSSRLIVGGQDFPDITDRILPDGSITIAKTSLPVMRPS